MLLGLIHNCKFHIFFWPRVCFITPQIQKSASSWGLTPDPTGGAYNAPLSRTLVGRGEGATPPLQCLWRLSLPLLRSKWTSPLSVFQKSAPVYCDAVFSVLVVYLVAGVDDWLIILPVLLVCINDITGSYTLKCIGLTGYRANRLGLGFQ